MLFRREIVEKPNPTRRLSKNTQFIDYEYLIFAYVFICTDLHKMFRSSYHNDFECRNGWSLIQWPSKPLRFSHDGDV